MPYGDMAVASSVHLRPTHRKWDECLPFPDTVRPSRMDRRSVAREGQRDLDNVTWLADTGRAAEGVFPGAEGRSPTWASGFLSVSLFEDGGIVTRGMVAHVWGAALVLCGAGPYARRNARPDCRGLRRCSGEAGSRATPRRPMACGLTLPGSTHVGRDVVGDDPELRFR